MKGTFFSADFIKDNSGNLRLLELNTDTAVLDGAINQLNYSAIETLISESSIDEVHVIYKTFQENFVTEFSSRISQNTSASVNLIHEDESTIYPTTIEDADNKFILRMAYDESAIFDSTYCKNSINPLSLFTSASFGQYVAEYYVSSSEYFYNGLNTTLNSANMPDVIVKPTNNVPSQPNDFYKIGSSSLDLNTRWATFTSSFEADNLIINFYNDTNDTKAKSYRSFNIIYGSNLDIIALGDYEIEALFEKPTSLAYDDTLIQNKANIKHYYEITTNYPKFSSWGSWNGIFEDEQILKSDNTLVAIPSASVGDSFKSYFISGSPNTDVPYEFMQWSYPGNELPSGSYATSSILINNIQQPISYNTTVKTTIGTDNSFRASGASHVLIYDSGSDAIRYEEICNLETGSHYMFDTTGSIIPITDVTFEILDGEYHQYIIDMESTDTFFINTGLGIKIVTHNCFPAGTEITLSDGKVKLIEDLTTEDVLLTYNETTKEYSSGSIGNIQKRKERLLIHLITEAGDVKSTALHQFFVKEKGWVKCQDILVGDTLVHEDGSEVLITDRNDLVGDFEVYHIIDVKNNHTYFANGFLVHNSKFSVPSCFIAGTEITLSNGDVKNIEDVVVGEEVLTYNEESNETEVGIVGNLKESEVNSIVRITLDNEIVIHTTHEHPFYVNGKGWVKAGELEVLDTCKKVNGEESIISTVDVLEETHIVYNLLSVSENHNFFANGILVHNK